jgi:hypothetical protein
MAQMNWQKLFQKHILDRGYDYYCEGAVESYKIKEGVITATVYGSDDYEIEIQLDDDKVIAMYCSCPHAGSGSFCKHMAAVLYEWETDLDDGQTASLAVLEKVSSSDASVEAEVKTAVAKADEKRLREFLASALTADERLYLQFKQHMKMKLSVRDVDRYKKQVDGIVDRYTDYHGFIRYSEASYFTDALYDLLEKHAEMMLTNDEPLSAFELTAYVFITASQIDMDDSSGCLGVLAEYCFELWTRIVGQSDFETKKACFNWFVEHLDGSVVDYMTDYLENMLMSSFEEPFFIQEKLKLTDQKVSASEEADDDAWYKQHRAGNWAQQHMALMETMHCSASEIKTYAKAHWQLPSVREFYVDLCMKDGNDDEAIRVLKESYQLDADYRGLMIKYSIKIKALYRMTQNHEAYKAQLWQLVLKDEPGECVYFKELKTLYDSETWPEIRERIFKELPKYAKIEHLYVEEKLFDRLLERVLQTEGLYLLNEYEASLVALYPGEILEKYALEVKKMAVHTGGRKHYQSIVRVLRHMGKIKGGNEVVRKIVESWRFAYANRPAMMDELSKLKINHAG